MYTLLLAVIYLAFISLGLPDSLLGSAWPVMQAEFAVPLSYAGGVSVIIQLGTVTSSLLSERMTRKLTTKYVTLGSVLLTAIALFGFSTADAYWQLCLWAIPYGLGAGAIDSALNNYVALHYASRHMSWLHAFWGVGTMISPYIMSNALVHSSWTNGYRTVAMLQLAIALVLAATLPLWKANRARHEDARKDDAPPVGLRSALKICGVWPMLLGMLCYCALESIAMLWSSSYLVSVKQIAAERAAAFASLFYIGITTGRVLAGFLPEKTGDASRIRIGAAVALAGVVCLLLPAKGDTLALVGLAVFGVGCGPVYPSVIHSTPDNFGERNSQAIVGIQMASAYVGAAFTPPVFGMIANGIGMRMMPYSLLAFLLAMLLLLEKAFRDAEFRAKRGARK